VIGRPLSDLYTYEWIDSGDEQIAWAALAHEGFWRGENRHVLRNGRVLHVESSVSVLHDAAGTRTGLLAVVRDVTASARSEAALQESSARNRMALDAADLGTWRFDVESGRVALDRRAREHYGVASRSVDISEIIARFHPDDAPGLQGAMEAAMDPAIRAPVAAECRIVRPDGSLRWLSVNGVARFEQRGGVARPVLSIGTTRDITDQKRTEDALRNADRRKDEFLAILAHELRNPLAPIRTAVGILQSPGVPEPLLVRSRAIIERQVAHMTRLIDDLLDVSRLSRGKMNLQRGPLLLDHILDAAIETARPAIDEHRHRLEQHRSPSIVCVEGDLARLSQVFANLLNNAAKFTPAGGTISIDVMARPAAVNVTVTDTGQGIAPDRLDSIFDLFTQGSAPSAPAVGGLGIGLALARRLVELHGGTLTASSPGIDRGATFTVTLATIASETACASVGRDEGPARHLRRRVLVVDDSLDAADTTAGLLESAGCIVRAANSGEQALEDIPVFDPEIVLLDIGMPGLNGLEVCSRIRALPRGRARFVVAVTGWGQEEDRRKTQEAGFDAHMVKPVAPDVLLDLVERAPARNRAE
jgi:PAS domain S-box-containing protein